MSKKKKKKKEKKKELDLVSLTIQALGLDLVPEEMTDEDYYAMSRVTSGQLFGSIRLGSRPS